MVVVDEFLFINPALFTRVITPLLVVQHTALLCLSTVNKKNQDEFDAFTADDAGLFKRFNYSFVCDKCRAQGLTTECEHIRVRIPPWHSERRHDMVTKMLARHRDDAARETLNAAVGRGSGCFGRALVDEWWALPRVPPTDAVPKWVLVAVDPANGAHSRDATQSSEFAVVATWFDEVRHRIVLCGVDSYPVAEPEDWVDRLKDFLKQIRAQDRFKHIPLVCVPENMTGTEAGFVRRVFTDNFTDVLVVKEKEFRTGLPSNAQIKHDMVVLTKLRMEQRLLRVSPDAAIACTGDRAKTMDKLKQQLLNYAELRRPGKEPGDPVRVSYTGKGTGPDDLATMLQFNVYATEYCLKSRLT